MSLNLIDLIRGQLGPATVSQAATELGESESGISKAISGLLPAIVGGLANNADKPGVLESITGASSSGLLGNLLGGSSNNSLITTILNSIFGDKMGGLVNAISSYAGISNSSSSSLMNMVTGATVGSLGKYASDNNLGTSGVSQLLADQKGIVSSLLPAGLSLASLGLGNWSGGTHDSTSVVTEPPLMGAEKVTVTSYDEPKVEVNRGGNTHMNVDNTENNEGGSIWKWLLPLLLLALAAWFLWKQCNKPADTTTTTTDSTAVTTDSANTMMPADTATMTSVTKTDEDIDLNGVMLKGYRGGMEDSMISFLKSGGYKNAVDDAALKTTWYNFDKVNFMIGSSTDLESGSQVQLDNLLAILKAYPEAKIKIGGYTDKTGNEADNVKLSQARADYIKKWLTDKGVGSQVTGADGYGSEFAKVAATATNEERAADRKMAVRFAK